jgi:serine phosphatase RsbU (regulator of sigma subunit)
MLENLHYLVQETLKSESEFAHLENGLDIALCKVNRRENVLEFSGAGLGLFICEGENVREITGQRLHLGFSNTRREYKFECQKVELKDDNRYYMVSDGVLDLPGGENGFGLGRKRLKKIIAEIQGVSLREQEKKLMKILENYRGNYLQRDDMVMIGFKVKRENRNA